VWPLKASDLPDPLEEDNDEDPEHPTMDHLHAALGRIEAAVSAAAKLLLVIAPVISARRDALLRLPL